MQQFGFAFYRMCDGLISGVTLSGLTFYLFVCIPGGFSSERTNLLSLHQLYRRALRVIKKSVGAYLWSGSISHFSPQNSSSVVFGCVILFYAFFFACAFVLKF